MSQKRFVEYQASVNSFPLSEGRVGILPPGRYRGFDTMAAGTGGAIAIKISHSASGIKPTDDTNAIVANYLGVMISKHGTILQVDDELQFTVDANASGDDRYDRIYMEYSWVKSAGGGPATFTLLKGSPGAGVAPDPPTPAIDVSIGVVLVPAGATGLGDLTWIPDPVPSLGGANIINNYEELDERYAIKSESNTFAEHNIFQKLIQAKAVVLSAFTFSGNDLVLNRNGNTFIINDGTPTTKSIRGIIPAVGEEYQVGTEITIMFLNSSSALELNTDVAAYNGFLTHLHPNQYTIASGDVLTFKYIGTLLGGNKAWVIQDSSYVISKSLYNPAFHDITVYSTYSGGTFKAGSISPGGYLVGKVKFLKGNITGDAVATIQTDQEICTLPVALRPTRNIRVVIPMYNSLAPNEPHVVFPRHALIETSGKITILGGSSADNAQVHVNSDSGDGFFLDGISYI